MVKAGRVYDVVVRSRRNLLLACVGLPALQCRRTGPKVIAVIPKATSHLFFVSVHAGVRQAAQDFHVEVLWNGPNDETDHSRQIQIVDSMLVQKVDGLAVAASDPFQMRSPSTRGATK